MSGRANGSLTNAVCCTLGYFYQQVPLDHRYQTAGYTLDYLAAKVSDQLGQQVLISDPAHHPGGAMTSMGVVSEVSEQENTCHE